MTGSICLMSNREPALLRRLISSFIVVLAALAILSACGGGGGGSGTPTATGVGSPPPPSSPQQPQQPDPVRPRVTPASTVPRPASVPENLSSHAAPYRADSEYQRAWGLEQVGAATAYARIAQRDGAGTAPGAGARVAVIDTGIDIGHWEFDTGPITRINQPVSGLPTHGTAVASVIAAQRNGGGVPSNLQQHDFHGIAWGVDKLQIMSVALGRRNPDDPYVGISLQDVGSTAERVAQWVSALAESDFVNMSFDALGLIENYRGRNFGALYDSSVQTLAQVSAGPGNGKTILVIAAGNANGSKCAAPEPNCVDGKIVASSPQLYAGLPVLEASLRDNVTAVVATDSSGRIASFSNRCGIAAKWCIAAPGNRVKVAYYGPHPDQPGQTARGYGEFSGTSFAAPYVTGGLAVLKHWFRSQMKNEELLARLYATARVTPDRVPSGSTCPAHLDLDGDLSDCELSSIFGRGIMDIGVATAPVGTTSFTLTGGPPAGTSRLLSGLATGDGMHLSLAGQEAAVFDELGAPFWIDASRFVQERATHGLETRVSRWLADRKIAPPVREGAGMAFAQGPGPAGSSLRASIGRDDAGHLGLVPRPAAAGIRFGDTTLSAVGSTAPVREAGVHWIDGATRGFTLSWQPEDKSALTAGWVEETDTLFGSSAEGAFGGVSSRLSFVGMADSFDAGGWHIDTSAELGRAMPEAFGMLADGGKGALSTAYSAAASRQFGDGTLRLSIEQPLRVERGSIHLTLPVGRTPAGEVLLRQFALGLEPSGRQIDFGVDWTEAVAPGSAWHVGLVLSREPGHVASRSSEAILLAGVRISLWSAP